MPRYSADDRLTEKRRAFARAYARQPRGEKNVTQAMRDAGYKDGPGLSSLGTKTMRMTCVRDEILRLDPADDSYAVTTHVDAAWILSELAELWSVDLLELFDEDGKLRRLGDMTPQARKLISSFEVVDGKRGERITKVKLVDRLKILQDIGRHRRVMAFAEETNSEADKSLAKLIDTATKVIEDQAPNRAIDVTPTETDDEDDRSIEG